MASNTHHDLTRGPVGAHLRRQAVPFSLGLVAIFSFEAIDLFFIAQLGDAPLAAVSFVLPVIWLVYAIGIGFEAGAASCVSRAVGRKDEAGARRLTTDATLLGTLVASGIVLVGMPLIDPVFGLLGATENLMPMVRDYMHIWFWVAPVDMALWTMLASIRARGNTLLESKLITAAALVNLALDPVFIFGLFGFPRLEVAGAALATLVSTSMVFAYTVWHLARRLRVFATPLAPLSDILASWRTTLHIGIPAVITNAIIPVSSGIVVALIADFGVEAVAGYGIAMRMEPLALIPFYALSAISSPFFGQNIGAAGFDRLREARRLVTRFCLAFGLLLSIVVCLAAPWLVGLYSTSESIRPVAVHYLYLVSWSWGAYGVVMSVNASFNGSGRPLPGVVLSTCRVMVVLLPLIWIGRALFGLDGLFAAISVSNLALGLAAYLWLGRHINRSETRYLPPTSGS